MALVQSFLHQHNISQIMKNDTFIETFCYIAKLPVTMVAPRIKCNGGIKVMKALGLYKTIKKGSDREILIDEGLHKLLCMFYGNWLERASAFRNQTKEIEFYHLTKEFYDLPTSIEKKKEKSTYIAYNPETMCFKIGRTSEIKHRLNVLRSNGKNKEIVMVATLPFDIEASLLAKYKQYHIGEEWFRFPSKEFVDTIINTYNFNRYTTSTSTSNE